MNLKTLTSKGTSKTLVIGAVAALLLAAVAGLSYRPDIAPATKRPSPELARLDTQALMARFQFQPLGRVPLADFQLPDLDGKPVRVQGFRGKVVLVNLWATW